MALAAAGLLASLAIVPVAQASSGWAPVQDLSASGQNASAPQVATDSQGRATVVWRRSDGSNQIIQARRIAADGTPEAVQDLSAPGQNAEAPQVAVDSQGRATVVWDRSNGSNQIVQARRIGADGTPGPVQDLSAPGQDAFTPEIAIDSQDRATVVWYRSDGSHQRIQAVRIAADGTTPPAFSGVQTLSDPNQDAANPQIAVDSQDRVTATWEYFDGSNQIVQARRIGADGTTLGAVQPLSVTGRNAFSPQIAVDPQDRATVVWSRYDGSNLRIQARRIAADGATLGSVQDMSAAGQDAELPQVAVDSQGRATVVWDRSDGSNQIVQARRIGADGTTLGAIQPLSAAGQNAGNAQVAIDSQDRATVVWGRNDGASDRIQSLRIGADGTPGKASNLSAADGNAGEPEVAIDPQDSATVVWVRFDGSNFIVQSRSAPADVGAAPTAYVAGSSDGSVYPVDTSTNTVGNAIHLGGSLWPIAITPDGATAYVGDYGPSNSVTPIDLATNTAGTPIPVGSSPQSLAITPDGATVYVGDNGDGTVTPIDTSTNTAGTAISVGGHPQGVAITPDGATAYVAIQSVPTGPRVTPIDLTTNPPTPGTPIPLPDGASPTAIAITPDGSTGYVSEDSPGGVIPIDIATNTPGSEIDTGASTNPEAIALTPDGATGYSGNSGNDTSTPIDLSTNTAGTEIAAGSDPENLAITPDGATAYFSDGGEDGVTPVDTASNTPGALIALPTGSSPLGIAITPDQPPTAAFDANSVAAGQQTSLDASASTDSDGTIASYHWDFGDGSEGTLSSPTVDHTYPTAGVYQVTLTVTDESGCSTQLIFTGQTAFCNGSSVARITNQVSVSKASPTLSTTASAGVKIGGAVNDTANLAFGQAPGGQITFRLYRPGDAICSQAPVYTNQKAVVNNGGYVSTNYTPTKVGTYRWKASYSGDGNNNSLAGTCGGNRETVTVSKATPALSTTASASVRLGGKFHDTATIAGGHSPTGTITFRLYGPGDSTCSKAPKFTAGKTVSGNGSYRSADFTPKATGAYRWRAFYSGDGKNAAIAGACNAPHESVTITKG